MTESAPFCQTHIHFHLNMIFKRMRMEGVFHGEFLRYRKGKTLWMSICQQLENHKQYVNIAIPWKNFCRHPLMYETTRFFKHCFHKTAWQVLAICLQILFNDQCESHQNNLAIHIFIALWIWIFCSDRN